MGRKFLDGIKKMIQKFRKKGKYLYRTGWQPMQAEVEGQLSRAVVVDTSSTTSAMTQPSGSAYFWDSQGNSKPMKSEDARIEKKPLEVFKELIGEEPKVDLTNIDAHIKLVKRRLDFMKDHMGIGMPADETEALGYLMARKKYLKMKGSFSWAVTNDQKIQALCKTYKVKKVSFTGYYKNVPNEALDELEKFVKAWDKLGIEYEPYFDLIVDDGGKETKKDPILLAKSPFGRWWYILGAWDKEVEIVDDLIYKGK